ncbi:MAG: histidine kinase dimerization/phosphoacceptor domain -containing protein [Methanobacterium sp.]
MKEMIKILILEDVSYDAELIEHEMSRDGLHFSSKIVENEEDYINALDEFEPDLILSDHSLPSFDGISALKIARKKSPDTPFFFVSGKIGDEVAVEMLKTGATDYIFKNNLSKLKPAIHRALKEAGEKAERRNAEESLIKAHDELENKVKERTKELEDANKELIMEIKRRKQLEEALNESKKKLKDIIHYSPVPQFVIDNNHYVIYWNKALETQSNIPSEEIVGTKNHWKAFYNYNRPCMADILVDESYEDIPNFFGDKYIKSEIQEDACEALDFFPNLGDKGKWLHFTATAIRNSKGEIIGAIETLEDVTEQKKAESEIIKSLDEKEVLLREIHHRVKNNLQIISSLINLQSNKMDDPKMFDSFKEIQNRVKSIALIHEKLYQSKDISKINFAEYIPQLASDLYRSYEISPFIDLEVKADDILLDINKALPCGLIINELITNSIKHAFPEIKNYKYPGEISASNSNRIKKGKININFSNISDVYELNIFDNGIGYPDDLDIEKTETLGLRLVNSLKGQLNSEIELKNNEGAHFRLTFRE